MDGVADVVVLEDEAGFDVLWEGEVVFAEARDGGGFVAEDAAQVEDHDRVAVLLWGELEKRKHFCVVVEVSEGVVDDGFAGGAELGVLFFHVESGVEAQRWERLKSILRRTSERIGRRVI